MEDNIESLLVDAIAESLHQVLVLSIGRTINTEGLLELLELIGVTTTNHTELIDHGLKEVRVGREEEEETESEDGKEEER